MGATTGIAQIGDYTTGAPSDPTKVGRLLALLPDPDSLSSSGAIAVPGAQGKTNTFLDEMSPSAVAQLRVELLALQAAVA